eukprot:gnl/TRDRNA2_/TRDRNA2_36716_c0_seq1.p1 gnl/TRDRNA2_/TRDRNA2_36716_c0~~gnl/TRDRNA2_/TRDRNA2_36716_c0_seq1.p1  ORF type:complete len:427 (-),score=93.17 gnl/TRDRNA2_/TRDRNA2_36716_c0_seq1:61-1341(-)
MAQPAVPHQSCHTGAVMAQSVSFLDFPWVLDYILASRFNCSLKQIRHAVCSIVLTLRTILSAAVELGILVSQDVSGDPDGAISAKPFIDNMIHVITECLQNFPLCLDSEFFHSFLEPLPSHLRFLCGNFHPLTHMQFEDSSKQKAFEAQTKAITQALSELPSQCSNLELYMSSQEPVLKQIQLIKEHLRAPLWMLMHDFRCLQGEERLLLEDVREAVHELGLQQPEGGEWNWPQVMGETLMLLLPLWKLSALAVAKGQETLMRLVARPPLSANIGAQRLLQRLIEVLLSEKADFIDITMWFAAEPSSAALLSSAEAVEFLLPEAANNDEFSQFRKEGLARVQQNIAALQPPILRLSKQLRALVSSHWRKVIEEVHLYLQLYLQVIEAFLEVQKEVRTFVHTHLFVEVTLGLPLMQWLTVDRKQCVF